MLFARASIGQKLLVAFSFMAILLVVSSLIGVFGFKQVAKTENEVVNRAIPSMVQAREVSELSSKILGSLQQLIASRTEQERQSTGKVLVEQLEALLAHIGELGAESFDEQLLANLANNVQDIIDTLAELGVLVENRLTLEKEIRFRANEMQVISRELETLTATQVSNTGTIATANVTQIYGLLADNKKEEVYNALDTLVEVDLDLAERLHELHLLAYTVLNQIEESKSLNDRERLIQIQREFSNNLKLMSRRALSVEDPNRSLQMTSLISALKAKEDLFKRVDDKLSNQERSAEKAQHAYALFSSLNTTVNRLVDQANVSTKEAIQKLNMTMDYAKLSLAIIPLVGFAIAVLIIWRLVYIRVLKRLATYSSALQDVSKGQLAFHLDISGSDELAKMGKAIVNARDTAKALKIVAESEAKAKFELEEHKQNLESLVAQRTLELVEANDRLNAEVENHAKAQERAEQASKAKSAFLATMSHEIRTPMNGVLGTARLLKESKLNKEQDHYVDVINRSGKSLLAILNDVLDYSKIEAGHLSITSSNFNVCELVKEVGELFESKAIDKNINLNFLIESDVKPYRVGDRTRIGQILANLIGNAVKFTDQGDVDISLFQDIDEPQKVTFEISDTGVGIKEQEMANLFEAFSQVEDGPHIKGGTGLGLAISKHLVEAMGGTIDVESEYQQGSCFRFTLTLPIGMASIEEESIPSARRAQLKILLVEDNPVNQLVARGFLEILGHDVTVVDTGKDAIEAYRLQCYDLALLDINLPDCSGIDLLQSFKQLKDSDKMVFVAVSAHVFNEDVSQYLDAGFDGFVPKPLEIEQLNQTIAKLIDHQGQDRIDPAPTTRDILEFDQSIIENDVQVLGVTRVKEIVEMFDLSSRQVLVDLNKANQEQDHVQITQLAHKLRGSASSLGLLALAELCKDIEFADNSVTTYQKHAHLIDSQIKSSIKQIKSLPSLKEHDDSN
ncbi:TMAO reductase system sensor histidine kinase/response regulator TorS [Vibrio sonorensis]|uniref:TMAO reductase system sensor histidine kinase/response regulator TorS n=1 Tax=Vibrio sonorensis TaxID=1004316 RepID=UPI0008DA324D|nr:TMAO reductase system sensor histidine kinase/response regulator TorS [Vibrio sonorensis]